MTAFGPTGSFPTASLPGSGASGVNYSPVTGTLTFQGFPPVAVYTFAPSRVYSEFVEVLHPGVPAIQVYSEYIEVLVSTASPVTGGDAGFVSILW